MKNKNEEENKEAAEGNEEVNREAAEEADEDPDEEFEVNIQELLVEDPNAKLEDENTEQQILKMDEGEGL